MPPHFFDFFSKKNSDNFVETNRTSEKFFGGNSDSSCFSFKAPSANAPAAMTRRLAGTSLVSGFHPTSFQDRSSDHRDSGPEKMFSQAKHWLVISRTF
jgi:hypothetical protein